MKAVVAAFNQEKALVGAFSVITNLRMELFEALLFTLHRRLGPLGFLSLGTSEVPGNAGMLDQVAALSWVQVGHCCCLSSAQLCLELQRRFAKISQSRRRLLLRPFPGQKHLLVVSYKRHYAKQAPKHSK